MKVEQETYYRLALSDREAKFLKGLLQNYLGEGEEPKEDKELRCMLWTDLDTGGVKL